MNDTLGHLLEPLGHLDVGEPPELRPGRNRRRRVAVGAVGVVAIRGDRDTGRPDEPGRPLPQPRRHRARERQGERTAAGRRRPRAVSTTARSDRRHARVRRRCAHRRRPARQQRGVRDMDPRCQRTRTHDVLRRDRHLRLRDDRHRRLDTGPAHRRHGGNDARASRGSQLLTRTTPRRRSLRRLGRPRSRRRRRNAAERCRAGARSAGPGSRPRRPLPSCSTSWPTNRRPSFSPSRPSISRGGRWCRSRSTSPTTTSVTAAPGGSIRTRSSSVRSSSTRRTSCSSGRPPTPSSNRLGCRTRTRCSTSPSHPAPNGTSGARHDSSRSAGEREVRLPGLGHAVEPRRDPRQLARVRGTGGARRMPASSGVRSRLRRLHGRHAAATFSHSCWPPRERGMMWSIESACSPQYWQRWSSRANTARRDSAVRRWYGTLTMYRSRITSGFGTRQRLRSAATVPSSSMMSALSASTRHAARRAGTTRERLVRGVQDQRAPHAVDPTERLAGAAVSAAQRGPGRRHHAR